MVDASEEIMRCWNIYPVRFEHWRHTFIEPAALCRHSMVKIMETNFFFFFFFFLATVPNFRKITALLREQATISSISIYTNESPPTTSQKNCW